MCLCGFAGSPALCFYLQLPNSLHNGYTHNIMQCEYYHIDAFTEKQFKGNPAGVCILEKELPQDLMLKIAQENGLAETAFVVKEYGRYRIRWFTPDIEMDLCGHATLSSAYVIKRFIEPSRQEVIFESRSGALTVTFENQLIKMDLPARMPVKTDLPEEIAGALSIQPAETYKARDYVLLYGSEDDVKNIRIDRKLFDGINLDTGGVCITARGRDYDFVSRFFTPQATILEDPVTGSAHCSLIPLWSKKLGKREMTAMQLSRRTGIIYCGNGSDGRVCVAGYACLYSRGIIETGT
jgi:PhzF family phenazine biosynthesis protein